MKRGKFSPIGINILARFVLLRLRALPPASEVLLSAESLLLFGVFGLELGVAISERSSIFLFGGPDGECTGFKVGTGTKFTEYRIANYYWRSTTKVQLFSLLTSSTSGPSSH